LSLTWSMPGRRALVSTRLACIADLLQEHDCSIKGLGLRLLDVGKRFQLK